MNRLLLPALALLSAATPLVVDSALKGAALMSTALLGSLLLWRASAAARHLVWLVAVLALLTVPLLSLVLPGWRVLPAWAVPPAVDAAPVPEKVLSYEPLKPRPAAPQDSPSLAANLEPSPQPPAPSALPAVVPSLAAAPVALPPAVPWWRTALPFLWSAGCAVLLLRLFGAHWLLRRAARRAQAVADGPLAAALAAAASQLGLMQRVRLLVEEKRTIPVVWGVWRPRLMLPAEALTWDSEQLQSVLLHELAHIRRRDTLVQWLTQLACALHWINPLVWLAAWRLHVERERACDDMVLASGVKPSTYAEHLLHIASQLSPVRWTSACGLAMARKSALEGRLLAVLSEKLNRRGVTSALAAIALILGAGIAIPVAMLRAAEEKWDSPSGAHIFSNDFSTFCIHDGKDATFVIAYQGDFDSSSRSSSNAKARTWNNDVTLTAKKPGIALSFLRTHVAPGKLSITTAPAESRDLSKPAPEPHNFGQKEYDLAKGRVFLLTDSGHVRQLDLPTPIVTDQESSKKLAALIAAIPPQQWESDTPMKTTGKLAPETITKLKWGEPVNGLRMALAWPPSFDDEMLGKKPHFELVVQNVSEKEIHLKAGDEAPNPRKMFIRNGDRIELALSDGGVLAVDCRLQPGHCRVLRLFANEERDKAKAIPSSAIESDLSKLGLFHAIVKMEIAKAPEGAWTGELVTGPTRGSADMAAAPAPKHKDARALYEIWQRQARLSGDIPGALIGELAAAVKVFIGYNPTWETVPKLKEILPRLDSTHDWKAADAIALLDEVAAVQDSPLQTAAEKMTAATISQGKALPEKFANVAWGDTQPNGLRAAWVLEPGAVEHRMGTALKARLLVQNTGKLPVMVRVPTWHQGGVSARDATDAEIEVSGIEWTTMARLVPVRFGPGEFIEISAPGVGLGKDAGRGPWAGPRVGSNVLAKDGTELTLTHNPIPLDGSGVGVREDAPHLIGLGWWQAHIKARLARELPLPASGAKRTHLLDRAMRELFATTPTADEIDAFATDQSDGAFDALVQRLAARANVVEFAGSLPTASLKIRVLPADPAADKTPRVVLGPGEYPLSGGTATSGAVTLKIVGRPVGDRRTNEAGLLFVDTEAIGRRPLDPHKLELPDGWGTWAIVCHPGDPFFYVLHKGSVRKIDYSAPRKVTDTPADDLPAEFRDEVKRQFDIHEIPAESQAEVFEKPSPSTEPATMKGRPRADVKPDSKLLFDEDYAAFAVQSEEDVNFVLFYQGDLSSGISEWSSGAKWRFNGTVYLVDRAKTAVAGKNVNKRAISVQYTSDEPKKLYLDGKAYDLASPMHAAGAPAPQKSGRVFILRDEGEPIQSNRTLALRDEKDLVTIGNYAVHDSVISAAEIAPKAPSTATAPGRYVLGDGVLLQVRQFTEGNKQTNKATITFLSPDPKVQSPHKPYPIGFYVPDSAYAFVWERGVKTLWVTEISEGEPIRPWLLGSPERPGPQEVTVRAFDFSNPADVKVTHVSSSENGGDWSWGKIVPIAFHQPVLNALGERGKRLRDFIESEKDKPIVASVPKTADTEPRRKIDWSKGPSWNGLSQPFDPVKALALAEAVKKSDGDIDDDRRRLMFMILKATAERAPELRPLLEDKELRHKDDDFQSFALALAAYDFAVNGNKKGLQFILDTLASGPAGDVQAAVPLGFIDEWDLSVTAHEKHFNRGSDGAAGEARMMFWKERKFFFPEGFSQFQKATLAAMKLDAESLNGTWKGAKDGVTVELRLGKEQRWEVRHGDKLLKAELISSPAETGKFLILIEPSEKGRQAPRGKLSRGEGGELHLEVWPQSGANRPFPSVTDIVLEKQVAEPAAKAAGGAKLTPDALLGSWRGTVNGEKLMLSFHRPRREKDVQLDIYFGEATIGAEASFTIAEDGVSAEVVQHTVGGGMKFGTLFAGEKGRLKLELYGRQKGQQETVLTRDAEAVATEPQQAEARALFEFWRRQADDVEEGAIPYWLVDRLADEVRAFVHANPNLDSAAKLESMLPRFATSIYQSLPLIDAIELLNDVAYYSTKPMEANLAREQRLEKLTGSWEGKVNGRAASLWIGRRSPVSNGISMELDFPTEGEFETLHYGAALDGIAFKLGLVQADGRPTPFGSLVPVTGESLKLTLLGKEEVFILTRKIEPQPTEPTEQAARELFEMWKTTANADGTIPGTFIGMLATEVRAFGKAHAGRGHANNIVKLLPRFVTSRDWTQEEAIKLLDDVAYFATDPITARLAKAKLPRGPLWRTMVEFQDIPVQIEKWSEPLRGLRIGMRIVEADWRIGGKMRAELWLHNAGENDVIIQTTGPDRQDAGVIVSAVGADGIEHSAHSGSSRILTGPEACTLPAGHIVLTKTFEVKFFGPENNAAVWSAPEFHGLPAGKYKLRCSWSDSSGLYEGKEWRGALTAPELEFTLAAQTAEALPPAAASEYVTVTIAKDGALSYERKAVTLAELKTMAAENAKKWFTIRADEDVPYARAVEVLDTLRAAGVAEITFSEGRMGDGRYRVANRTGNYEFDATHKFSICMPSGRQQWFTVIWPAKDGRPARRLRFYPELSAEGRTPWAVAWEPGANELWWVDDVHVGRMTLGDPDKISVSRAARMSWNEAQFGLTDEVKLAFRRLGYAVGYDGPPGSGPAGVVHSAEMLSAEVLNKTGEAVDHPKVRPSGEWSEAWRELSATVAAARGTPEADVESLIAWGDTKDGLRSGVLMTDRVKRGARTQARLVVRNVSDKSMTVNLSPVPNRIGVQAAAADGTRLQVHKVVLFGTDPSFSYTFKPGQQLEFAAPPIQFGVERNADGKVQPPDFPICGVETGPGTVSVRYSLTNVHAPDCGEVKVVIE